jgi:hypothetical protein
VLTTRCCLPVSDHVQHCSQGGGLVEGARSTPIQLVTHKPVRRGKDKALDAARDTGNMPLLVMRSSLLPMCAVTQQQDCTCAAACWWDGWGLERMQSMLWGSVLRAGTHAKKYAPTHSSG